MSEWSTFRSISSKQQPKSSKRFNLKIKDKSHTPFESSSHQREANKTNNNFHSSHRKGPSLSPDDTDEVDECCSYIGQLLITDTSSRNASPRQTAPSSSRYHHHQSTYPSKHWSNHKTPTMTIGHHHHYNNRHHYPYHDHYHDDSPLLPRIEFPSSQFDRLLRGSPNMSRSSDITSNRYTSSSSSPGGIASTNSSSPFSSSSTSSTAYSSNSSNRLASWKTGPFDSRRK